MPKKPTIATSADKLGAKGRAVLGQIETLTAGIETSITMTREAWRDYGAILLEAKALMPDTKKFGAWVKANGLNVGLAKRHEVRSKAMWMARYWNDVQSCTSAIHPTACAAQYNAHLLAQQRHEHYFTPRRLPDAVTEAAKDLETYGSLLAGVGRIVLRDDILGRSQTEDLNDRVARVQKAAAVLIGHVNSPAFVELTAEQRRTLLLYGHSEPSDEPEDTSWRAEFNRAKGLESE